MTSQCPKFEFLSVISSPGFSHVWWPLITLSGVSCYLEFQLLPWVPDGTLHLGSQLLPWESAVTLSTSWYLEYQLVPCTLGVSCYLGSQLLHSVPAGTLHLGNQLLPWVPAGTLHLGSQLLPWVPAVTLKLKLSKTIPLLYAYKWNLTTKAKQKEQITLYTTFWWPLMTPYELKT